MIIESDLAPLLNLSRILLVVFFKGWTATRAHSIHSFFKACSPKVKADERLLVHALDCSNKVLLSLYISIISKKLSAINS